MNDQLITEWTNSAKCRRCGIRSLVLFEHLTDEDFFHIHEPIGDLSYQQEDVIYQQNESNNFIYTIRTGLVKLEISNNEGSRKIVRLLKQGDVFGLEALLDEGYRHSAVVLESCEICQIPTEVINDLQLQSKSLCRDLMKRWDKAIMASDDWMLNLNSGNSNSRVEKLIQYLHENSIDTPEFYLPSRSDMASILGLSKETVSRIIAEKIRDQKLIPLANGIYELV